MRSDVKFYAELAVSFLPFIMLVFLNSKVNVKKENRNRQYVLPFIAVIYSVVVFVFQKQITQMCITEYLKLADL